jgi:hypothetical protein
LEHRDYVSKLIKKEVIEMKKKLTSLLLIMLFLSFFAVTEAFSITFYVDTTIGKDSPNNWGQSPKKPWKTIAFAVQQTCVIEICEEVVIKIAGGTYNETIIVNIRPLSLEGTEENGDNLTIINSGRQDAITIDGVHNVVIKNVEVINANNGIIVKNGGSAEFTDISVEGGTGNGFYITGSSNANLSGSSGAKSNDGNGILVEESSSVIFDGSSLTAIENKADGVLILGVSSLSLKNGTLSTDTNIRGIVAVGNSRIRVDAGGSIRSIYNVENGISILEGSNAEIFGELSTEDNFAGIGINIQSNSALSINETARATIVDESYVGILVSQSSSLRTEGILDISTSGSGILVSGSSSMRAEGGKIDIWRNGRGILIRSGSTIELKGPDPESHYNIYNGSSGIAIAENSFGDFNEVKIFDNTGLGLSVGSNSQVSAYDITIERNVGGVKADGGSVFLEGVINGNGLVDVNLIFGAHAILSGNIGTISCDGTVLIRGDEECP